MPDDLFHQLLHASFEADDPGAENVDVFYRETVQLFQKLTVGLGRETIGVIKEQCWVH